MSITPAPVPVPAATTASGFNEKNDIAHVESAEVTDPTDDNLKREAMWADIKTKAEAAEAFEKGLSLWEAVKIYRKAVFWSLSASMCIIMEGYDTAILGAFWALPSFRMHYGQYYPDIEEWQVPAKWQTSIGFAGSVGGILGIFWGAFLVQRLGYRKSLLINLAVISGFIGIVAFSPNKEVLLVGEFLSGFPFGAFSTLPIAYASEVCPVNLRGYLTSWINLCWCVGQLLATSVILGYSSLNNNRVWSYRLPWILQWFWPVPLGVLIFLAPESPWYLVRAGKLEEAEHAVMRLAATHEVDHAPHTVAMMVRTNQLEIDLTKGASYLDCFRGSDLRRTEISMVAFACQVTCGLYFAVNATYFFENAGLQAHDAYKISLGMQFTGVIGVFIAWFLIPRFGRRTLYIWGLGVMSFMMLLIGILAAVAKTHPAAMWGQAACMFIWVSYFAVTVGPLAFAIVGETSSTRLRNRTVALARNCYNVVAIIASVIIPFMLNPTAWNWRGYTGFFWAPICFASFVWAYFRLPEMKGRSYYELDIMFERKVPARKFASYVIEADADDHQREAAGVV